MPNPLYSKDFLQTAVKPGVLRILAAIFYDIWLIAALWLLGTTVDTFVRQAINVNVTEGTHLPLQAWFLLSPLLFFGWFWTHGGQSLGMRAWRIRVVDKNGEPINWRQSVTRYFAAALSWGALGLGFLWVLFDRDHCSWHDRLSSTYLVMTEKRKKPNGSSTHSA